MECFQGVTIGTRDDLQSVRLTSVHDFLVIQSVNLCTVSGNEHSIFTLLRAPDFFMDHSWIPHPQNVCVSLEHTPHERSPL